MTREMPPLPPKPSSTLLRRPLLLVFSSGLVGCAATLPGAGAPATPAPSVAAPVAMQSPPSPGVAGAPTLPAPASRLPQRLPEIVLDPKQPLRALPELKVENIGLHVGGGPNDAETKGPFLNAVAERFPAFMDCYRKNEDPASGGRFGIDLHIARSGGHPHIEQPRSALRGAEFRSCIASVFESVEFQRPKRGPTTISYSLRFLLVEAP